MYRPDYIGHVNQDFLDSVNPKIDRMKIHGYERLSNGIWGQVIGDEFFELDPKKATDAGIIYKLEKQYQEQQQKKETPNNESTKSAV